MMKGKVVFELAYVGSKSEGVHPFLITEDGKKVKLGLVGDNPFMHPKLKAYDQKTVELEGEFNDNGKFIATAINVIEPSTDEIKVVEEVEETKEVKSDGPHIKRMPFVPKPVVVEPSSCETQTEEVALETSSDSEEKPCCGENCCKECAENTDNAQTEEPCCCEGDSCCGEKETCEE